MSRPCRWLLSVLILLLLPAVGHAQETLAWLNGPEFCSPPEQSVGINPGLPQPQFLACSASYNCGDGNVISCTGSFSCLQNVNPTCRLQCDGACKRCPNYCQVQLNCPGSFIICFSERGDCAQGQGFIRCDGRQVTCEDGLRPRPRPGE